MGGYNKVQNPILCLTVSLVGVFKNDTSSEHGTEGKFNFIFQAISYLNYSAVADLQAVLTSILGQLNK